MANAKEPIANDLSAPLGLELNNDGAQDFAKVYFITKQPEDKFRPGDADINKLGNDPTTQRYNCGTEYQLCASPLISDGRICGDMSISCKCPNAYMYIASPSAKNRGAQYCTSGSKLGGDTCVDPRWPGVTRYTECVCDTQYKWTDNAGLSSDCQAPKTVQGSSCTAEGSKKVDNIFTAYTDPIKYTGCGCSASSYPYTSSNCSGEYSLQGSSCTDDTGTHYSGCGCNVSGVNCDSGEVCTGYACGGTVCTGCQYNETCYGDLACPADQVSEWKCDAQDGPRYNCRAKQKCDASTYPKGEARTKCVSPLEYGGSSCNDEDDGMVYSACVDPCASADASKTSDADCGPGYYLAQTSGCSGGSCKPIPAGSSKWCEKRNTPPSSAITFTPGTASYDGNNIDLPFTVTLAAPYSRSELHITKNAATTGTYALGDVLDPTASRPNSFYFNVSAYSAGCCTIKSLSNIFIRVKISWCGEYYYVTEKQTNYDYPNMTQHCLTSCPCSKESVEAGGCYKCSQMKPSPAREGACYKD